MDAALRTALCSDGAEAAIAHLRIATLLLSDGDVPLAVRFLRLAAADGSDDARGMLRERGLCG